MFNTKQWLNSLLSQVDNKLARIKDKSIEDLSSSMPHES
jgi:hypothetical protein